MDFGRPNVEIALENGQWLTIISTTVYTYLGSDEITPLVLPRIILLYYGGGVTTSYKYSS